MPFQIIRGDITKIECDAIVNTSNEMLRCRGEGVDAAIHAAAGPELQTECDTLGGCRPGEAKATKGYRLPCRFVIHTVGPVWNGGTNGEEDILASCYRESLGLAKELKCESVAFPLIASGVYGYPKDRALNTALSEIGKFLFENEMLVYIVVFDKKSFQISKNLVVGIEEFIDDDYVAEYREAASKRRRLLRPTFRQEIEPAGYADTVCASMAFPEPNKEEIKKLASNVDESFSQMIMRKIIEKDIPNKECYSRSNIDKKLFSKIIGNIHYKPKKTTALAFAIGLELSISETKELLMKAGYALSPSSVLDKIVEYFISIGFYDIFAINAVLFDYDQALVGSV